MKARKRLIEKEVLQRRQPAQVHPCSNWPFRESHVQGRGLCLNVKRHRRRVKLIEPALF